MRLQFVFRDPALDHRARVEQFLRAQPEIDVQRNEAHQRQAWDKIRTYTGQGSFIGWLLKVAYTTFLQSKRRSNRYSEILEEVGQTSDLQGEGVTEESNEVGDLDKFLAVLTEEERAVMILSYACGLSHREISDAAELPVGTVKSIIFRGKEKIREAFDIQDHKYG